MQRRLKAGRQKESDLISDPKPHPRGELAKEILMAIAAGELIPASLLMPIVPKAFKPLVRILSRRHGAKRDGNFLKSLSYLKRNRLVSISEKDGQEVLSLTEDGRRHILSFNINQMAIKRPKRWDGYWRIVVFDISERRKKGREALRSKLKQLGFYPLQKSCFAHPFDCKSEVDFLSELSEVSPFVNLIVAKEIEGGKDLRRIFDLA